MSNSAPAVQALNSSWSFVLPFITGLVSGFIAMPMLEFLKDAISARRAWGERQAEIVSSVRFVLGQFSGFQSLCEAAYGERARFFPEKARPHVRLLKAFDLATIAEKVSVLAELHPKDARISAASQYLVSQVSATLAAFLAVQQIEPNDAYLDPRWPAGMQPSIISTEETEVWNLANVQLQKLHIFLGSIYAPKMQLDRLSFAADAEIAHFEIEVLKHLSSSGSNES